MDKIIDSIFNAPRSKKRAITLVFDSFFIFSAFWLALVVRLDSLAPLYVLEYWFVLGLLLPTSLITFVNLGLYRAVLRYMNAQALWAIVIGTLIATVALVIFSFFLGVMMPRSMPFIFAWLCLLTVGGSRIVVRAMIGKMATSHRASYYLWCRVIR